MPIDNVDEQAMVGQNEVLSKLMCNESKLMYSVIVDCLFVLSYDPGTSGRELQY
jgi:hypothetical protein